MVSCMPDSTKPSSCRCETAQAPFIKGLNTYELALEAPPSDEEELEFGAGAVMGAITRETHLGNFSFSGFGR